MLAHLFVVDIENDFTKRTARGIGEPFQYAARNRSVISAKGDP
jgi:hypothetical protein